MKILPGGGKEHLDVEINGRAYRLSGQLTESEFTAFADRTTLITQTKRTMSPDERKALAAKSEKSSPKDFTAWLQNQSTQITTNLQPLSDQEKEQVMQTVCNNWPTKTLSISFYDKNQTLLQKSKNPNSTTSPKR
jgi:hypothetical protein